MARYVFRRPHGYWYDDEDSEPMLPFLRVYDRDPRGVDTGLVTKDGHEIYRTPDMGTIGFLAAKGDDRGPKT